MKIVSNGRTTAFENVDFNQPFLYKGELFMAFNELEEVDTDKTVYVNAISLCTGHLTHFEEYEEVEIVRAHIVIE